jgi:hypothetical protein
VFPVKYELASYIQEDGILHGHGRENLNSYIVICILHEIRVRKENVKILMTFY